MSAQAITQTMTRTRYAPSPTGYMHIGNVKNALNQYLLAKSRGGSMILRIEDTDKKREVSGAVDYILQTLKTLFIDYDEGPFYQSERRGIYMEHALALVDKKKAYYCFCSKERLEALALDEEDSELSDVHKYDRKCLSLPDEEIQKNLDENLPFVIRQIIPEGQTTFKDELRGEITIDNAELDDQILIKSDGYPTYNFCNVVDDHLMGITHVIRDERYLSSTPKYNLLYGSFGWDVPIYVHNALLCAEDGSVYSKRKGAESIDALIERGFLPEAIFNYTALLGWSPGNDREIFSKDELIESFTIQGMSKSPSKVDIQKLEWFNAEYFKLMDDSQFFALAKPILAESLGDAGFDLSVLAKAVKSRITFLKDIPEMLDFLLKLPDYDISLHENKKQKSDGATALIALEACREALINHPDGGFKSDILYAVLQETAAKAGLKNSQVLWPLRIALSGLLNTPVGASDILALLGKDESVLRIEKGISALK